MSETESCARTLGARTPALGPRHGGASALRRLAPLAAGLVATCVTSTGQAQTGVDAATSSGKGIAAGILLGAETVVLAEAAFGVKPRWAYLVGAGVGAVGGGVGGYFLEDNLSPKTATLLLASGMVLAIPATVAALSASSYTPPADYVQDSAPTDEPVTDPPRASSVPSSRRARLQLQPPMPSLVAVDDGEWRFGIPAVALLDVYSTELRLAYNLNRETEVRVPVLAMRF